jgi:hypothetical protein
MFKNSPRVLYKFGKTLSSDILERFSVEYHESLNWRGIPLGRDYNIKPIWSMWVTKERAVRAENWFKEAYPKEFFCTRNYNGITECRNWTVEQHQEFTNFLYATYPATEQYKKEINRLKMQGNITQTHTKIYYIMLTKKQ